MKSILHYLKSFLYSNGKPQPVYFWITALMILVVTAVVMRLMNIPHIDNALVGILCGFVAAWVALYNTTGKSGGSGPSAGAQ